MSTTNSVSKSGYLGSPDTNNNPIDLLLSAVNNVAASSSLQANATVMNLIQSLRIANSFIGSVLIEGQANVEKIHDKFKISTSIISSVLMSNASLKLPISKLDNATGHVESEVHIPVLKSSQSFKLSVISVKASVFNNSAFASNPLTLDISYSKLGTILPSYMKVKLQNFAPILHEFSVPSPVTIQCYSGLALSHEVICNDTILGKTMKTIECDGTAGVIQLTCPYVKPVSVCNFIRGNDVLNSGCRVASFSSSSTTCLCPLSTRRRRYLTDNSSSDSSTVSVDIVSMAEYLAENTGSLFASAENLNASNISRSWKVVVTMSVILAVIILMFIVTNRLDQIDSNKHLAHTFAWNVKALSKKIRNKRTVILSMRRERMKPQSLEKSQTLQAKTLDDCLPTIYGTKSYSQRFIQETKRYHRWIGVILYYSVSFPRVLRVLTLVTNIFSLLFLQAITYTLRNPDDGTCEQLHTKSQCLSPQSPYLTGDSKCYWITGTCKFRKPGDSLMAVLYVAVFATFLSAPIVISSRWVIMKYLAPPTRSSVKVEETDESFKGRAFGNATIATIKSKAQKLRNNATLSQSSSSTSKVLPDTSHLGTMRNFDEDFVALMDGIKTHRLIFSEDERKIFDGKSGFCTVIVAVDVYGVDVF